jgi:hypothetical protein
MPLSNVDVKGAAYSHRRMSLKTGGEVGGSRVSFLVVLEAFGADQREARRASKLVVVFPS